MTSLDDLIDRYIAMWNETNAASRRDLIAGIWTDRARYVDPLMEGEGHAGIDEMVAGLQARFPNHHFRRIGPVDTHHDCVRFAWELVPESGPALARGIDVGTVDDGRLATITGFLDAAPGVSA